MNLLQLFITFSGSHCLHSLRYSCGSTPRGKHSVPMVLPKSSVKYCNSPSRSKLSGRPPTLGRTWTTWSQIVNFRAGAGAGAEVTSRGSISGWHTRRAAQAKGQRRRASFSTVAEHAAWFWSYHSQPRPSWSRKVPSSESSAKGTHSDTCSPVASHLDWRATLRISSSVRTPSYMRKWAICPSSHQAPGLRWPMAISLLHGRRW
mmetsp:Transcript_24184/g.55183  ORF Transcript_24184/g.55183 Transcript_24184/m.55183 type:complete len:204 (-) Transcript_24184:884-1495(-)